MVRSCSLSLFKHVRMDLLRERFKVSATDKELEDLAASLIRDSYKNKYTAGYDLFQQVTNNIAS